MSSFVVAFYELDRAYGGPEEGGWWFDTGSLSHVFAVASNRQKAERIAERANRLLKRLQRHKTHISSVSYAGGRHAAIVFQDTAPKYFPDQKPTFQ